MIGYTARLALAAPAVLLLASLSISAQAQGTLRIAMTASDVPTTTGAPDNRFEGLRFLGYPVYDGLVPWDLTRADNSPSSGRGSPKAGSRTITTARNGFFTCGAATGFTTAAI
jgi:hypothetical protein